MQTIGTAMPTVQTIQQRQQQSTQQHTTNSESETIKPWGDEEKLQLAKFFSVIGDMQKAYGQKRDFIAIIEGWTLLLQHRFTVKQVITAAAKYMTERDDFPSPANICEIINPPRPKVTYAQYKEAVEWMGRNREMYGLSDTPQAAIARAYNDQYEEEMSGWNRQRKEMAAGSLESSPTMLLGHVKALPQPNT